MTSRINEVSYFFTTKTDGSAKIFPKNKQKPSVLPEKIFSQTNLLREDIFEVHQVHSNKIHVINSKNRPKKPIKIGKFDGMITNLKNVGLIIKTADCIPIVFYNKDSAVISGVHAGWRGLVSGIQKKAIRLFKSEYEIDPKMIKVYLGPSIRSCCYKFKDKPTQAENTNWKPFISKKNEYWHIDMQGFLVSELIKLGVKKDNILDSQECTYHLKNKYYSHLRHKNTKESSGTMITIVQS